MKLILLLRLPKYTMWLTEKAKNPKFAFSAAALSSKKFFLKDKHNRFAAVGNTVTVSSI